MKTLTYCMNCIENNELGKLFPMTEKSSHKINLLTWSRALSVLGFKHKIRTYKHYKGNGIYKTQKQIIL